MSIVIAFVKQQALQEPVQGFDLDDPHDPNLVWRDVAPEAPGVGEMVKIKGKPWSVVARYWDYRIDGNYCVCTVVPLHRIEPEKPPHPCEDPTTCNEPSEFRVEQRASGPYRVEYCSHCGFIRTDETQD